MCANWFVSRGVAILAVALLALSGIPHHSATAKEPAAQPQVAAKPAAKPAVAKAEPTPDGAELFAREWLPNDSRAHGGDGLGPVFNDSSCIACHNQGGTGGAGPASKNVDIVTAFIVPMVNQRFAPAEQTLPQGLFQLTFGSLAPPVAAVPQIAAQPPANSKPQAKPHVPTDKEKKLALEQRKKDKEREKQQLVKIHPGFASARSVVLHHFSTDPKYQQWRSNVLSGQFPTLFIGNTGNTFPALESGTVTFAPLPVASTTDVPPPAATSNPGSPPAPVPAPQQAAPSQAADVVDDLSQTDLVTPPVAVAPAIGPFSGPVSVDQLRMNAEAVALQGEVQMKHSGMLNSTVQNGNVQISHSQRNPIALFGIGLIDAIPEKEIVSLAKLEHEKYPDVAGRPAKQKDGKIGRFGWKAQKPSLEDFTLTACAVELGLNVPGHEQAGVPLKPDYKAPGLDMNKAECDALVGYLRNLPAPSERKPATAQETAAIGAGHKLFASVGCANCHVEKVGATSGLYSDLLLHDMGPELGDSGDYGVFTPDAPEEEQEESIPAIGNGQVAMAPNPFGQPQAEAKLTPQQMAKLVGALRQEWRTPPLWGVRDSGPYLHDGRADTLEQAIAFHGGQGSKSALKFFQLKPEERAQLISFLKSLTAPEPAAKTSPVRVTLN